ncbi:MAG: deoxyribonuclease IV [Actinomycetota bacterium]|nr:deoxyribonuclease IV [Actinomycetota bacterium]MDA2996167.1 deoxyribonuclease IV [Actinomycetota bacterium]
MASPRKLPRLGAHTPTSGGMAKRSIAYAQEVRAEAIQVFASNPRGWAMPDANVEADTLFRDKALELDIETYVHAPFLINLGSPTVATYENSVASTAYSLRRAREIGSKGAVVHTGSAVDVDYVDKAWKQIKKGVMPVLNKLKDEDPWLLLEPTAGQGQSLVKKLDDLLYYFEALEWHPKVGVCLDTCHVFAAGHDIAKKGGMTETLDLLVKLVGIERIKLIHTNDSMDVCGALKDRHQNLGDGEIGLKAFEELLAHPVAQNAPLILETPGMEEKHGEEIALLSKMRDKIK